MNPISQNEAANTTEVTPAEIPFWAKPLGICFIVIGIGLLGYAAYLGDGMASLRSMVVIGMGGRLANSGEE